MDPREFSSSRVASRLRGQARVQEKAGPLRLGAEAELEAQAQNEFRRIQIEKRKAAAREDARRVTSLTA